MSIGVGVYDDAVGFYATSTWLAVPFTKERWDTSGFHSVASNTSRLTVPAGQAGQYAIAGHFGWDNNNTGDRGIAIRLNGGDFIAVLMKKAKQGDTDALSIATVYNLAVGDYVELMVEQESGGSLACETAGKWTQEFRMTLL